MIELLHGDCLDLMKNIPDKSDGQNIVEYVNNALNR